MLTGATVLVGLAADFGGMNKMVAGGLDPLLGLPPPQLGAGRVLMKINGTPTTHTTRGWCGQGQGRTTI